MTQDNRENLMGQVDVNKEIRMERAHKWYGHGKH